MMTDIDKAKQQILNGGFTCALCCGEDMHTSTLRGVKPLVLMIESGYNFSGYSAADKVVGRATAFLYLLLGIKSIYAHVISRPALELLNTHGISVEYANLAENIINRQGDGICPFESAVLGANDEKLAYTVICDKMREMNITLE